MNKRNPWAWVPTLYFAEGVPYVAVMTISLIMYKRLGLSNTDITLYTSWLYLPWVIKPLWSPFIDIIKPASGGEPVYFAEIDKLSMATSIDNVFEKSILKDESGIKIKFGDGISGAIPPEGTLYVNYVETMGSAGNLDAKYQINTMIFPSGYSMKDPRTGTYSTFLSCTNISSIQD